MFPPTQQKLKAYLGKASLLFMYSLYSSCVSKSQRPRGPFLFPFKKKQAAESGHMQQNEQVEWMVQL